METQERISLFAAVELIAARLRQFGLEPMNYLPAPESATITSLAGPQGYVEPEQVTFEVDRGLCPAVIDPVEFMSPTVRLRFLDAGPIKCVVQGEQVAHCGDFDAGITEASALRLADILLSHLGVQRYLDSR